MWLISAGMLLIACDARTSATAPTDATPTLKVDPPSVELDPRRQALFTAHPAGLQVAWSIREASGGTITGSGLYTAPASAGAYHVIASAGALSAEALVTVLIPVAIAAEPTASTVACVPVHLSATVTGSTNSTVLWRVVDPSCGTITEEGTFTSARGQGSCVVQASAAADPAQSAQIAVEVLPERVLSISLQPATSNLHVNASEQFLAVVTTTCGTFTGVDAGTIQAALRR